MRLTYLKIENFGKHKLLEYDLSGCSVIGLVGANKSGKSTVLKALEYVLTGQTGQPNSQVYIEYGQPSAAVEGWFTKEGKSIKIKRILSKTSKRELNIDGKIFTAAKDVDEQMDLLFDGIDKKLLSQLVFVSQGELTSCLFGDQSDKENVFSKLIGIGHLYKLAEGVEQQITEMESKIRIGLPELIASMADMISENAEEIAVTENALKLSQDYTSVLNLFTSIKKQDELRSGYHLENNKLLEQRSLLEDSTKSKCLNIFEKFQFNKKGLEEYKTNLDNEYYQLSGLLYKIQSYHKDKQALELLRQEYSELNANYEKLCKSCNPEERDSLAKEITDLKYQKEQKQSFDKVVEDLVAAEFSIKNSNNTLDSAYLGVQQLLAKGFDVKLKQSEIAIIELRIQLLEATAGKNLCECPLCGNTDISLDNSAANVTIFRDALSQHKKELFEYESELKDFDRAITTNKSILSIWTDAANKLNARKIELTAAFNHTHKKELVDVDLDAINREIWAADDKLQIVCNALVSIEHEAKTLAACNFKITSLVQSLEARKELDKYKQEEVAELTRAVDAQKERLNVENFRIKEMEKYFAGLSVLISQISSYDTKLKDCEDKLTIFFQALMKVIPEDAKNILENIDTYIGDYSDKQKEHERLGNKLGIHVSANENLHKKLEDLKAEFVKNEKFINTVEDLKQIKSYFSKSSSLLRKFMGYKFRMLCDRTNANLQLLDATFNIIPDHDKFLNFHYREDGKELDQSRLSGGQRTRLSLAFLLAIQQEIMPSVGFLVLDEPSNSLDLEGVEALGNLIENMSNILSNTGAQVIMADHHETLIKYFVKCINLNKC